MDPTSNDALAPLGRDAPCGPSLEYDHEYAVLLARMVPRESAQYGSFMGVPEAIDWAQVERDCQRLLLRTRDINLYVWLVRARARLGQARGLAQALSMLCGVLAKWPQDVHPQLVVDGERDPALRANALAGLSDPEGLLADIGEIVVDSSSVARLTVRDVDRALATPRVMPSASPESVMRQLAQLSVASPLYAQESPMPFLERAAGHVHWLEDWAKEYLGDDAPSLTPLRRMLQWFEEGPGRTETTRTAPTPSLQETRPHESERREMRPSQESVVLRDAARTRDEALAQIVAAREWFEMHEPSSPVAVLLKQAARLVGQRFAQVADCIPPDLLKRWDSGDDAIEASA